MSNEIITAIIASALGTGVLTEVINWVRNRGKDKATAKLTDVQTLQAQLTYVEGVAKYLRQHSDDLEKDYTALEEKYRKQRERISELEEEIRKVRQSAAQTQQECEELGRRLEQLLESDDSA